MTHQLKEDKVVNEMIRKEASELVKACDHYLSNYQEALPRVAWRGLLPIFNMLIEMMLPPVEIFRCPLGMSGRRGVEGEDSLIFMRLVWGHRSPTTGDFCIGYQTRPYGDVPEEIEKHLEARGLGKNDYREVSMEEVVELGVGSLELIEYVKRMADATHFRVEVADKATQKMAQA